MNGLKFIFIFVLTLGLTSHTYFKSACLDLNSVIEEVQQSEADHLNYPNCIQIISTKLGCLSVKIQQIYIRPHSSYFVYTLDMLGPHHASLPPPNIV